MYSSNYAIWIIDTLPNDILVLVTLQLLFIHQISQQTQSVFSYECFNSVEDNLTISI
jgi:hypothetical protein